MRTVYDAIDVVNAITAITGMRVEALRGKYGGSLLSDRRKIAAMLMSRECDMTSTEIGAALDQARSGICRMIQRGDELLEVDPEFARDYWAIYERLTQLSHVSR